jgi:proteasome lid subunit RPN8/RPN11
VTEVYPLPNTEQSPVRYLADPQAQLDAMLAIEESGLEIVGIYHSHPDAPAFPSPTDVAMAAYPNAVHLIISLMEGKQPVFGAFWIRNGEITPVDIIIDAGRAVRGREAAGSW